MKYTEEEHDWETQYHISSIEWEKRIKKLKAENAKLQEFAKAVIRYAGNTGDDYLANKARAALEDS